MPAYRRLHKGSRGGESFGYLGEVGFEYFEFFEFLAFEFMT